MMFLQACDSPPTYKVGTKPSTDKSKTGASKEGVAAPMPQTSANTEAVAPAAPISNPPDAQPPSCDNKLSLKSDTAKVLIPKNDPSNGGKQCPFGQNDNDNKASGTYSARLERRFDIQIPSSRVVCSMDIDSRQQKFQYDDHLFLTLNNNVLVASRGIPTGKFTKNPNGFFSYDWSKIRGTKASSDMICATDATCELPKTETTGLFSFKMSEDANKRLFSSLAGQQISLNMIITGDDNPPTDCGQMTDLELNLNYKYFEK